MFRGAAGLPSMMKDGASHFKGREEATLRNIDAARRLYDTVKSSYGPNGMCKLVNNYIDKRFLTADGQTIISNLEVQHPAAKILAMASEMQNSEFGDCTLFVIILAAELLINAGELIQDGVHESFIIKGYEMALAKCIELMKFEVVREMSPRLSDIKDIIKPLVASKVTGEKNAEKLTELIEESVKIALNAKKFNTDNVRVTKLTGGNLNTDSQVVNGLILLREPKTEAKEKHNAKVIIVGTGIEPMTTEGTSTVLITKSEEMKSFSQSEEEEMEKLIKYWKVDLGIEGVICGGNVCDIALHYMNKYGMWNVSVPSRFDLKRLSRVLGVPVLSRLSSGGAVNSTSAGGPGRIMSEDIGLAEYLGVGEFGGRMVTIVRGKDSALSTILLRGMSMVLMDEFERCVDDCVSLIAASLKDQRFVAGGGHIECKLSLEIDKYAQTITGIEQYGIQRFGQALKVFPTLLAENAGQNALSTVAKLVASIKTQTGDRYGVNLCSSSGDIREILKPLEGENLTFRELAHPVYDHYLSKEWAIRLACDAALTLLRVDQIIMSKPAGGPKLPNQGHWDAADDRTPGF